MSRFITLGQDNWNPKPKQTPWQRERSSPSDWGGPITQKPKKKKWGLLALSLLLLNELRGIAVVLAIINVT